MTPGLDIDPNFYNVPQLLCCLVLRSFKIHDTPLNAAVEPTTLVVLLLDTMGTKVWLGAFFGERSHYSVLIRVNLVVYTVVNQIWYIIIKY